MENLNANWCRLFTVVCDSLKSPKQSRSGACSEDYVEGVCRLHWCDGGVAIHSLDLQEGGGRGGAILVPRPAHQNVGQVLEWRPLGEVGIRHPLTVHGRV